jgi:hypothetical protein
MSDVPAVFVILIFVLAFGAIVTVVKAFMKRNPSPVSAGAKTVVASPGTIPRETQHPVSNETEQLKQVGELHASGILTDEEFAAKKAEILKRI